MATLNGRLFMPGRVFEDGSGQSPVPYPATHFDSPALFPPSRNYASCEEPNPQLHNNSKADLDTVSPVSALISSSRICSKQVSSPEMHGSYSIQRRLLPLSKTRTKSSCFERSTGARYTYCEPRRSSRSHPLTWA